MVSRPRPYAPEHQTNRLLTRMDRVENGAPLRSTSVTGGRTRFFGLESLWVIGSAMITGALHVVGRVVIEGLGILTVNGMVELVGNMLVKAGGWIKLDGGYFEAGNVRIENNLIRVGPDITIDATTNQVRVADMVIDPERGGQVQFPGGANVRGGSTGGVEARHGEYAAVITSAGVSIGRPGRSISVTEAGIQLLGVPNGNPGETYPAGVYYNDPTGMTRVATGR